MSTSGDVSGPDPDLELERTKQQLSGFGELAHETASLIDILKLHSKVDLIDWQFQFPYMEHSRVMLPAILADKTVLFIDITSGETNATDPKTGKLKRAASLSVDITTADGVLKMTRTNAPEDDDPDDAVDAYFNTDPTLDSTDMSAAEIEERTEDVPRVSQAEFNALIISMIANDPETGYTAFANKDLLAPRVLPYLNEALREKAITVYMKGIHGFHDDESELEFSLESQGEFFDLTYRHQDTKEPIVVHGIGTTGFGVLFERIRNGIFPTRLIPTPRDFTHVQSLIAAEVEYLRAPQTNDDPDQRRKRVRSEISNAALYADAGEIALQNVTDRNDSTFWDRAVTDELLGDPDDPTEESL